MTTWVFADTETTGLKADDKIVELAWVAIDDDGEIVSKGESLINPQKEIHPGAASVHHITLDVVKDCPTIEQFMDDNGYPLMVNDPVLICHNVKFDIRYLKPWMPENTRLFDTLNLARILWPDLESHKLQTLRYQFNLKASLGGVDAHRAMGDVAVLINLVEFAGQTFNMSMEDLFAKSLERRIVQTMKFGKHKGKKIIDLPKDYVRWLLDLDNLDEDLRHTLNKLHCFA